MRPRHSIVLLIWASRQLVCCVSVEEPWIKNLHRGGVQSLAECSHYQRLILVALLIPSLSRFINTPSVCCGVLMHFVRADAGRVSGWRTSKLGVRCKQLSLGVANVTASCLPT